MASKLRSPLFLYKRKSVFISVHILFNQLAAGCQQNSSSPEVLSSLWPENLRDESHKREETIATSALKSVRNKREVHFYVVVTQAQVWGIKGLLNKISLLHHLLLPVWSVLFGQYKVTVVPSYLSQTNSETIQK